MVNYKISDSISINDSVSLSWPDSTEVILDSERFRMMDSFVQHGNTSCMLHSIAVAYYSLLIVRKLGLRCNKRALVRGALLHDYFLYDWHIKEGGHKFHGFLHPAAALENAKHEYPLTELEENIVLRHMFPLTLVPPRHREGFIVCVADKLCSLYEVFARRPYKNTIRIFS